MKSNIIFRRIHKNIKWFSLNTLGLTIAFVSLILVSAYVFNEFSYDKFHTKHKQIYRFTQNSNTGQSSMIDARVWTGYANWFNDDFPQIKELVRLMSYRNAIIDINENAFYSRKVYGVDSSFFKVFDFELLVGSKNEIFIQPGNAIITESLAKRYFGSIDVLDKQIKITHQKQKLPKTYNIKGVLKDFPKNSHFKADILCSFNNELDSWAFTYLLLPEGTDYTQLQQQIQEVWNERNANSENKPLVNLQNITDIHLHSHKSREMEANGNIKALILLVTGMLIIILITFINYANLNYVQYVSEQNTFMVKTVNGATPRVLAKEFLLESWTLMGTVAIIGAIIIYNVSNNIGFGEMIFTNITKLIILSALFFIVLSFTSAIPFLYRKPNFSLKGAIANKNNSYKYFVVAQMALSVFAITTALFLQKQLNHISQLHPNANNENLVVLPNIPSNAVGNYETLKHEALKHSEIIDVCAALEEPGGIITDNFPYTLGNDNSNEHKTINVLITDNNFIDFFNIKTIAGSSDFGNTPPYKWEQQAIDNWRKGINDEALANFNGKYVINRMALKHLGLDKTEAIGKPFNINFMGALFPKGEIIGVIEDFHYTNMYVKEKPLVLIPRKVFSSCLLFKIDGNKKNKALSKIRNEWKKLNPGIPFKYEFVTDTYQKVYKNEYIQMKVIMVFALISILLSALGLFAMVAYSLKAKIKEIGIRRANGATVLEILQQLINSYLIWIFGAVLIASPFAYLAIKKWLESFAYQTSLSWWVFALSGLIGICIALLTISWQTYNAARKNPVEALRYE